MHRLLHRRVVATEREDAEPRQQIQVARARSCRRGTVPRRACSGGRSRWSSAPGPSAGSGTSRAARSSRRPVRPALCRMSNAIQGRSGNEDAAASRRRSSPAAAMPATCSARQLGPRPAVAQQVQGPDGEASVERVERHQCRGRRPPSAAARCTRWPRRRSARASTNTSASARLARQIDAPLGAVGLRVLEDVHQLQRLAELDGARAQLVGRAPSATGSAAGTARSASRRRCRPRRSSSRADPAASRAAGHRRRRCARRLAIMPRALRTT